MHRTLLIVTLAIGCGASSSSSPGGSSAGCPSGHPSGAPSDYHAVGDLEGITVSAPMMCSKGEAYLRITRRHGGRRLGTAMRDGGGFNEGCMTLPADPKDFTQCPVVNPAAIFDAGAKELEAKQIQPVGEGLGPCGDPNGDYDAWHMALGVHSWAQAEVAVRIVAGVMTTYDVNGFTGVAVRGIGCAIPL